MRSATDAKGPNNGRSREDSPEKEQRLPLLSKESTTDYRYKFINPGLEGQWQQSCKFKSSLGCLSQKTTNQKQTERRVTLVNLKMEVKSKLRTVHNIHLAGH